VNQTRFVIHPIDAWIEAIPEDPYAPCPCGCGKKFRFAFKEGVEQHEARFAEKFSKTIAGNTQ
jgi:hypothetical protein